MSDILPTEAEWLAERKKGLGGSDAAAALGVPTYKTPYELWADKVSPGEIEPDAAKRELFRWGHLMEQPIAKALAEDTGRNVMLSQPYAIRRHPTCPIMFCTPDAIQRDGDRGGRVEGVGIVQIKNVDDRVAWAWKEGPPLDVEVQIQHEMECTSTKWGTIAALIGKSDFRYYDVEYDPDFVKAMMATEAKFWQRVVDHDPPPLDGTSPETYARVLRQLHPQDSGETISLTLEVEEVGDRLLEVKAEIKNLADLKTSLENEIKQALGDATFGTLPGGGKYSWKTTECKGYTVKATQQRTLRRLKK